MDLLPCLARLVKPQTLVHPIPHITIEQQQKVVRYLKPCVSFLQASNVQSTRISNKLTMTQVPQQIPQNGFAPLPSKTFKLQKLVHAIPHISIQQQQQTDVMTRQDYAIFPQQDNLDVFLSCSRGKSSRV